MHGWARLLAACCLIAGAGSLIAADERAQLIFAAHGDAVVQIRVIDVASGDKSSLGSGFQVDPSGLLATNFHVISDFAHKPKRYKLEYLTRSGKSVAVALHDVDIVHDLALLKASQALPVTLALSDAPLTQGERLFSMGNPLDLAMTIIDGTYNGFVSAARYRKILFSASLNPGMSGGPAVDANGTVVGVNVAHGGEQISFLVPAQYLLELIARGADPQWQALSVQKRIERSLVADQQRYFTDILAKPWNTLEFGEFRVPGQLSETFKCWGGSTDNKDLRFDYVFQKCDSSDSLFIEEYFDTGTLEYGFERLASEELNTWQFYNLLARYFKHKESSNAYKKEQVGNFRCQDDFVRDRELEWRVSYCARQYRRYKDLYDVSVAMSSTELTQRGLVVKLRINGISEPTARQFVRRFVESIEWKP